MKFTGKFLGAKIDIDKYQQQLREAMIDALEEGARIWLQAVVGRVPLWSGMARGSLLELSELVSGRVVFTPLKARSRVPAGRRLGTAEPKYEKDKVTIKITTDVPHYTAQEYRSGISPSAPWRSLMAGAVAFKTYAESTKFLMPKIKPIKIKAI